MANQTRRRTSPNRPGTGEGRLNTMKVVELRQMARERDIPGAASMRKDDLVRAIAKASGGPKKTSGGPKKTAGATAKKTGAAAKKTAGPGRQTSSRSGVRAGSSSSRSLRYAQVIESTEDRPERPGRSLVTTNHDVIRRWAEQRDGIPATVEGTKQRDTVAVLRFDFPLGGRGNKLRHVSWDEWFKAFDQRGLNFIYQEQMSDGRTSNFFRLENPEREDG